MEMKILDIVKYEKEKATEKLNKLQSMKELVKVFEIVFALILVYWSTMKVPLAVRIFKNLFELSVYLVNPHFVFLIGNAIILSVFLRCKQDGAGNHSGRSEASPPPLTLPEVMSRLTEDNGKFEKESQLVEADKHVQNLSNYFPSPERQKESQIVEVRKGVEILSNSSPSLKGQKESQIVEVSKRVETLSNSFPSSKKQKESQIVEVRKEVEILSNSFPRSKVQCEAVQAAIAEAEQEIRRFERTLSPKLKKEMAIRPRKELWRSETERRVVIRPSIKTVEHLSNEEFKSAIDAFIDKHTVFSKQRITE